MIPVSVVILTYNGGRFITGLLDSLADQSYPRELTEVIVIDNASGDGTAEIAERYPWAQVVRLPRNLGYAGGNALAPALARHETIAFLNQDVICHRDWLAELVAAFQPVVGIGAVASNMVMPGAPEFAARDRHRTFDTVYFEDLSVFGYGCYRNAPAAGPRPSRIVTGCSFMTSKTIVARLGYLFDVRLWMYVEDTDFSLRLVSQGFKLRVVPTSIVYHLHEERFRITRGRLRAAARAIMNRVFVFYSSLNAVEFAIYLPFLLAGGPLKLLELRMSWPRRIVVALPFALFSLACMIAALPLAPLRFSAKRRQIMANRHVGSLGMLSHLLGLTA